MAGTLAVVLGVAALTAKADVWDKKTILSVNQPIQVQDTFLEPGTYVFKLHNSNSNRHIVHIYNRDENRLINTVMAIPNYRLQPTGKSQFTFYETPQEQPVQCALGSIPVITSVRSSLIPSSSGTSPWLHPHGRLR